MAMPKSKKSRGITTIQITEETKNALKSLGKKGETYDDVIRELMKLNTVRQGKRALEG